MNLDPASTPGDKPERVFGALSVWAKRMPWPIGSNRTQADRLDSVHVAYRQADDCQPRPEIVVQFTQRRAGPRRRSSSPTCRRMRAPRCGPAPP